MSGQLYRIGVWDVAYQRASECSSAWVLAIGKEVDLGREPIQDLRKRAQAGSVPVSSSERRTMAAGSSGTKARTSSVVLELIMTMVLKLTWK